MVELCDQEILLLFCLPRCRDIANEGSCPSPVPSVEPNTNQRQRQYGETRYSDPDGHPTRWHAGTSHYYRRIAHNRSCRHSGEVQAEDREREKERTLQTVK